MHLSKKLDLEMEHSRKTGDIYQYIKVRKLRTMIGPFDKYRMRLMDCVLKTNFRHGLMLDIGSNIGELVEIYRKHSSGLVLCDRDYFFLNGARISNSGSKNIKLVSGNLRELPFKKDTFDAVVTLQTLEHLVRDEQARAVSDIIRVAKPGSYIYISMPNRFSLAGLEGKIIQLFVKGYRWDAWDTDHKYIHSSWEFVNFLKGTGRDAIDIVSVHGSYFLPGSIIIRMPLWLQGILGFLSYLFGRYLGYLFPFCCIGFTTMITFRKKR